jgi:1-pyrroline-5-carboxylate dehydrogenase
MANGMFNVPTPSNEPVLQYLPGSDEKIELKKQLEALKSKQIEIPLLIGGEEVRTGNLGDCVIPHNHGHMLGKYHKAGVEEVAMAVRAAAEARKEWAEMPWDARASILLKAAELLSGPHRSLLNAATMLCQSKTVYQAEIDSACELIDFYRFNPYYMARIYGNQPDYSAKGTWNRIEYRPLEGFVFAVTPFNFTSIAGNLPTSPALMGNVVLWKPASSAVYTAYYIMKLLEEAGFPPGVVNFIPGSGGQVGVPVMKQASLAGIHFTGSTSVFHEMWGTVGGAIREYNSYPRIVGETGGKDFIFVHHSADTDELLAATIRGAFEYQGQKCSAASRMYVPESLWSGLKDTLMEQVEEIRTGDIEDFGNFMGAVIDRAAFRSITEYIDYAAQSSDAEILTGGTYDDSEGYFISPTVIKAKKPDFKTMCEEIFGPVLTLYVYPDNAYEETLRICDESSPYGLTGAIFGRERKAIERAVRVLRNAAGNFYINDKPTGAVVGQQPFGGSRASGTNDKAGSYLNLIRWTSARTIKENFLPPKSYGYPYMAEP